MTTITSLGTGSGLDLEGILTKLMTVEQQPLTALATKEASYQAQLSAYGTLKSSLSSLQTAVETLADKTTYTGFSTAVSDSTVIAASASNTAAAGSYSISVGQLAQGQVLRSNTAFAATTDTFNTGTIAISLGGATAKSITINSGNNTLSGIADAINAAGAGVTASIVNDGTTNRLLLASSTTGATASAISVSVTDSGSGGTHALSTLDGASLVQVQAPLDASFSVNGLSITRPTNSVTDVISGVTLSLAKAGTIATPLTTQLNVTRNTSAVQTAIASFVSAYNDAVNQIKSLSAYNSTSSTASVLTGDSTLRTIQNHLSSLINSSISSGSNISHLTDLGVSVQKDGTLSTNATKLSAALNNTSNDISGFFTNTGTSTPGFAVNMNSALDSFIGTSGMLANRTDGINKTITDIGNQQTALSLRLTQIEATYRAQFTALDSVVASMQSTSSYLTTQLSYLQAIATGVNSTSNTKVGG